MMAPRRTNPLSPLVQAAPALPAVALFFIGPGAGMVERSGVPLALLVIVGAMVGYGAFAGEWTPVYLGIVGLLLELALVKLASAFTYEEVRT